MKFTQGQTHNELDLKSLVATEPEPDANDVTADFKVCDTASKLSLTPQPLFIR